MTHPLSTPELDVSFDKHVAIVEIRRPPHNYFDIPMIKGIADVFDALISPRPYKAAWSIESALEYLREQSGRLFDPACVDALVREQQRLREICAATALPARIPFLQ